MGVTTRYEQVASDGDSFDAYCAVPETGRGPGVLVFQEIFGVNDNMRGIAERLAQAGFVALVPDMFWRIERRFERNDESGMADASALMKRFSFKTAAEDIQAAHAHLLSLPACTGKVGAMGFCLGGTLAFVAATSSRVAGKGPDAAVCYYGSAINGMLDQADRVEAPLLFHYGTRDKYISAEKIAEIEQAMAGKPGVEIYRYDAGHAFSNWDTPSLYDEKAATQAWPRTVEFLSRNLA